MANSVLFAVSSVEYCQIPLNYQPKPKYKFKWNVCQNRTKIINKLNPHHFSAMTKNIPLDGMAKEQAKLNLLFSSVKETWRSSTVVQHIYSDAGMRNDHNNEKVQKRHRISKYSARIAVTFAHLANTVWLKHKRQWPKWQYNHNILCQTCWRCQGYTVTIHPKFNQNLIRTFSKLIHQIFTCVSDAKLLCTFEN